MVVVDGSVVVVVSSSMRKHELQSVVGVVVCVEASLDVCGKNWTASRGQMSVVGHDSEESLSRCLSDCLRPFGPRGLQRPGHALAYVCLAAHSAPCPSETSESPSFAQSSLAVLKACWPRLISGEPQRTI